MKKIFYFLILFQISLVLILSMENDIADKYTNKSYFAVIGITGEGKSAFVNKISEKNKFSESSDGNSETQQVQDLEFIYNNDTLVAIDTPGLDDSLNNNEKIQNLKALIYEYPKIKCIVIVKKYNNFRISLSLQKAIELFMESFPLENFWDYVIVINTWSNPKDVSFQDYYRNNRQNFVDKINKCDNIRKIMIEKGIQKPSEIKEYFVDIKEYENDEKMKEIFNMIKSDILNKELMFKNVTRSEIKISEEEIVKNKLYRVKTYRVITCTDFDNKRKEINETLEIKLEKLSDANRNETKKRKKYKRRDGVRWYDIVTLSISWWFRKKDLYSIYYYDVHKIGNLFIEAEERYIEDIWE